jgi:hypothetical protein
LFPSTPSYKGQKSKVKSQKLWLTPNSQLSTLNSIEKKKESERKPGSVISCETAVIYLGDLLPNTSSGSKRNWKKTNHYPYLASNRGLPSQHLSMLLVRSYRTFAPLPDLVVSS